MSMTLTFGKHRGKEIEEAPSDYLRWLQETLEDDDGFNERNPGLYEEIEEELLIRDQSEGHFYEEDA